MILTRLHLHQVLKCVSSVHTDQIDVSSSSHILLKFLRVQKTTNNKKKMEAICEDALLYLHAFQNLSGSFTHVVVVMWIDNGIAFTLVFSWSQCVPDHFRRWSDLNASWVHLHRYFHVVKHYPIAIRSKKAPLCNQGKYRQYKLKLFDGLFRKACDKTR